MKVSKIFGCVLSLHICVIAVLLVQPGCQTGQPPTQTHTQMRATKTTTTTTNMGTEGDSRRVIMGSGSDRVMKSNVKGASRLREGLIPATRSGEGQGLDSAFNAGFEGESSGLEPLDPIEPLEPISGGQQTVDVDGPGFQSYTVKKGDNLWSIAKRYDVSLNELYAANGLNKNSVLRVGQQIQIPVESGTETIDPVTPEVYQPSTYNQATTTYTVKRGDTLSKIANQYNTTVRALKTANGKSSDIIRVGENLTVPVESSSSGSGQTTSTRATSTSSSTSSVSASSSGATQTHTVKSGEYPAKIARQYGMTTSELLAMNGISDPRKLRVGQTLTVSGTGSAANVDSRVETVQSRSTTREETVAPVQATSNNTGPVEIKVIEADPLVEGEMDEPEFTTGSSEAEEDVFNDAVEIPVIRLEE